MKSNAMHKNEDKYEHKMIDKLELMDNDLRKLFHNNKKYI